MIAIKMMAVAEEELKVIKQNGPLRDRECDTRSLMREYEREIERACGASNGG